MTQTPWFLLVYLLPTLSFSQLAHTIQAHRPDWIIKELRACTFPSRPEPKRALWIDAQEQPTILFCYDPDPEVRTMVVFDAAVEAFSQGSTLADLIPTESWSDLHHVAAAKDTSYVERWRAICAWRRRGEHAHSACGVLGEAHGEHEFELSFEFLGSLLVHPDAMTRQIAAAQLEIWAEPKFQDALRQRNAQEPDLHVRLLMRRALDNIERQEMAKGMAWRRGSM